MPTPDAPLRLPIQLDVPTALALSLLESATDSLRKAVRDAARARRPRRGETLKPGANTPLWNELSTAVRGQLTRYGDKARLGRILGLPRQRINDLLRARRHLPDGERTLLLLVWLHARRQGQDLA